ncbi:MAG: YceI family protein [Deltaproteobacteria bacterium]|nr:YceI family protein [Deltaproteobacteria bacterium]
MRYRIDSGTLTVKARSKLHDTTTVWSKLSGTAEADPDTLATAGATATFTIDMTTFDAGDWLKNRKLKSDFALDKHPTATFELRAVRDVVGGSGTPTFTATAEGVLRWRGKEVVLVLAGRGTLDRVTLAAAATFELDITQLGLTAPRFLMIKMEDVVSVDVAIRGSAQP